MPDALDRVLCQVVRQQFRRPAVGGRRCRLRKNGTDPARDLNTAVIVHSRQELIWVRILHGLSHACLHCHRRAGMERADNQLMIQHVIRCSGERLT